jgi:predicted protein tyrosine phosphatase
VVPFKLTVCGISELSGFAKSGVSHVLSILDPAHPEPPAFYEFDPHHRLELRFHDVIDDSQPGFSPPREQHIKDLLAFGERMDAEHSPTHLLVHCHMGISRSSASMILLLAQARPDLPAERVANEVVSVRPIAWPNLRMISMGDALLGRKGELIEAARGIYRRRAIAAPETVEFMRQAGRLAELTELD